MAYKQQNFISPSSGGWNFKIWVPVWLGSDENSLLGFRLLISPCDLTCCKGQGHSQASFIGLIPSGGLHSHDLITPQRPQPPNTVHWGLGFNIRVLREHKRLVYSNTLVDKSLGMFSYILSINF